MKRMITRMRKAEKKLRKAWIRMTIRERATMVVIQWLIHSRK